MITWIKKYWRWLVGSSVVLAALSFLSKLWQRPPAPVNVPTKDEADKKHAEIEKKKNEAIKQIENEVDKEMEDVRKKFGSN